VHDPHNHPVIPAEGARQANYWALCARLHTLASSVDGSAAFLDAVPKVLVEGLGVASACVVAYDDAGAPTQTVTHPADGDVSAYPIERCVATRASVREARQPTGRDGVAAVAVPWMHGGQVAGVLAAAGRPAALGRDALVAMEIAAVQCAAVTSQASQRRLGRLAAEWAILQRVDMTIRRAASLEEAMAGTLGDLATVLLSDQAMVVILDANGDPLHVATRYDIPAGAWAGYRELVSYCRERLRGDGSDCLVRDVREEDRALHLAMANGQVREVRALAAVPLRFESIERWGFLVVSSGQPGAFSGADLAILRRVAAQAAASLDHIIMSEQRELFLDVQESLVAISRALSDVQRGEPLSAALRRVVESVVSEAARIRGAALHLLVDGEPVLVASSGSWPCRTSEGSDGYRRWDGAVRQALSSRKAAQVGAPRTRDTSDAGPQSLLVLPLSPGNGDEGDGPPLGVLSLLTARLGFFVADLSSVLLPMARVVARTVRNMQHLVALERAKTELALQHEAILRSRSTLEALFESFPYSIFIVDTAQRVIMRNSAGAEAGLHARCSEVLPCRGSGCDGCRLRESLQDGRVTKRTVHTSDAEGEDRYLEVVTYPIRSETQEHAQAAVVAVQDVTAERRLTESLIRVEKFTAIGRLASSIVHEINNPLAVVALNAELLCRALKDDDELGESAELIFRGAQRVAQAVRNLQSFSRDEAPAFAPTNLHDTVTQAVSLVAPQVYRHGGTLCVEVPEDLPQLLGSAKHLEHVWSTLVLNALDILISAGEVGTISIRAQDEGDGLRVTVWRGGPHIPPSRVDELFSPFGLTSLQGLGSGLGLYGCQRIIQQHGGTIRGRNVPEGGFCFEVWLPIA